MIWLFSGFFTSENVDQNIFDDFSLIQAKVFQSTYKNLQYSLNLRQIDDSKSNEIWRFFSKISKF